MAEMIFGCPHCGEAVQCDSEYAGQTVACPHCQGGIIVPAEEPAGESVVSDQSPVISDQEAGAGEPAPEPEPKPEPEPETEPVVSEAKPEPKPEPTPEAEPVAEPEPKPEAEEAAASEEAGVTEDAAEGSSAPVAPKPKQPRLPSPGAKTGKKKVVRRGGKIMTKKGPLSSAAAGAAATKKPAPAPSAESSKAADSASAASGKPELAPGELPKEAKGWSWAAFLWGPIWAIGNKVWWGLLTLVPAVNLVMIFILAIKGKKQAWAKAEAAGKTIEQFVKVQKRWVLIWLILFVINILASVGTVMFAGAKIAPLIKGFMGSGAITIEEAGAGGMEASSSSEETPTGDVTPIEDMDGGMDDVEDLETPVDDTEDPPSLDMDEDPPALEL